MDPAAPTGCGSWTVALSLRDVDTGVEWRAGAGGEGPEIVVSGAAGELVLWLAGREATVEIAGDQRTASRLGAGLHI